MRTYFSDIIPKIQRFSRKLDNLTLLTNQHWVVIDDLDKTKIVYIFRQNNELLISQNGKVEKAKWEYLGNNSLLIDKKNESYLFKHGFFDENILALRIDSLRDEYVFLVNETKFEKNLNSSLMVIEFLQNKYIEPSINQSIQNTIGLITEVSQTASTEEDFILPSYEVINEGKVSSLLNPSIKYIVRFEDGTEGLYFRGAWSKKYYIKRFDTNVYYEDECHVIMGLYSFIKYNVTREIGRIFR